MTRSPFVCDPIPSSSDGLGIIMSSSRFALLPSRLRFYYRRVLWTCTTALQSPFPVFEYSSNSDKVTIGIPSCLHPVLCSCCSRLFSTRCRDSRRHDTDGRQRAAGALPQLAQAARHGELAAGGRTVGEVSSLCDVWVLDGDRRCACIDFVTLRLHFSSVSSLLIRMSILSVNGDVKAQFE